MRLPIAIIYSILITFPIKSSYACTCNTISFEEAVDYAEEIFIGRIVKAELYENGEYYDEFEDSKEINWSWKFYFEVEIKWKGSNKDEVVLYHQGNSCDFHFDIYDKRYLVYASSSREKERWFSISGGPGDNKKKLSTWLCSRTMPDNWWDKDNMFDEDFKKLNDRFPELVKLGSINIYKYLIIVGLMLLISSLFYKIRTK